MATIVKSRRGFAAMSKEKRRAIARKGGKASRGQRSKSSFRDLMNRWGEEEEY
ncbi:hypothetical protein HY404_04190 [Candidatus Microgenomates bacterium]|nr:hypothetical protein [Candidatus Microgenomates bacterium]